MTDEPLRHHARAIPSLYERQAAHFDATRAQVLFEKGWLNRFLSALPAKPRILDLGCGSGRPISAYLARSGARVTGLDVAGAMIALAKAHAPHGDWRQGDMRNLDLGETFDGILSWDAFFHLAPGDQRAMFPRLARHLKPGGALLLTVGPCASEVMGQVGTDPVYHASLDPEEYLSCLARAGLRRIAFAPEDPDCDGHSILMAVKD